eukprot:CAMPEP_0174385104 /NCGR_PEP_ID=MMETSP0811_2-20130205/126368_1 /TAXON_ID=73025 ORGANISM="Eutreptiella gymnastica-like, Strain CCMP1594" /NCGR_SAMPLE_ID=MMETSP0811_2 /ASSEMBLY_ACC=CAM_ASM_000667 /LENGTH=212 /DNA_ID=CAMNT_0015539295 /DNA_START=85 /DNA_END=720 /DNA_ORIENTATION=+
MSRSLGLFGAGGACCYLYLAYQGHVALWGGPERSSWSKHLWEEADMQFLARIAEEVDFDRNAYLPMTTTRNFLRTGQRNVRYQFYWVPNAAKVVGLVHFGAETEGFPQKVHNGCSTSIAECAMQGCAQKATDSTFSTCIAMATTYRKFIPLGSTVFVEAECVQLEGSKAKVSCKLMGTDSSTVYWDGVGTFVNLVNSRPLPAKGQPEPSKKW